MDTPFVSGREPWLGFLGNLRDTVRQELVSRQLHRHLSAAPGRVLDVGAGQGTQAIRLARMGYDVLAVEPDESMREVLDAAVAAEPSEVRQRVRRLAASAADLPQAVDPGEVFDAVLCHGVLMYLPDPGPTVVQLSDRVAPGGVLSLLVRNADGMALRPGLRRQWADVLDLLDEQQRPQAYYTNGIGVRARADRLEELASYVSGRRMHVEAWYGVRVLTDGVPSTEQPPTDPDELATLLDAEERVGSLDPYRRVAALLHVIGRRPA